jgi:acetyl esterase/lipase
LSGPLGVYGSSAGGHLAALLGTSADVKELEGTGGWEACSSRVQAVVEMFGPTDLLRMAEALKREGAQATLHVVKGAGHGPLGPEADAMISAFFDRHLKRTDRKG